MKDSNGYIVMRPLDGRILIFTATNFADINMLIRSTGRILV